MWSDKYNQRYPNEFAWRFTFREDPLLDSDDIIPVDDEEVVKVIVIKGKIVNIVAK